MTAGQFARAVAGRGHDVAPDHGTIAVDDFENLSRYVDAQGPIGHAFSVRPRRAAKKFDSSAPHSSARTPPVTCGVKVQSRLGKQVHHAAAGATLGILRAEYQTRDACMNNGTGTHCTRLQSDIERAAGQAIVAQLRGGVAQRRDFGVRTGVMARDGSIEAAPDDLAGTNEHRAYRHFVQGGRLARQRECFAHELLGRSGCALFGMA